MIARAPKNPLLPTRPPTLPPAARSRAALGLTSAAARGRFALQVCDGCATVQYPPREVCGTCLSASLVWRDVPSGGTVLATTTVRASGDPYFRQRLPWRIGLVQLDCGPPAVAHLHRRAGAGEAVRMRLMLDRAGQGIMMAVPVGEAIDMTDDPALRAMTCDPRGRRVLVTDVASPVGRAVAAALIAAGAHVFGGIAEAWRPHVRPGGVEIVPLDTSDADSVHRLVGSIGGRVEIVVSTGAAMRAGAVIGADVVRARAEMEAAYFGPMRLGQAFGPALMARGDDGTHPACAWVSVLSVYGLVPRAGWSTGSAAMAAALSLSRSLRTELRPGGIRVIDVLTGPVDDDWHRALPPPKLAPSAIGAAVVAALRDGVEEFAVGDVAREIVARWHEDATALARDV